MRNALVRIGVIFVVLFIPAMASAAVPRNVIGRILLQTEAHGEAWYVSPVTEKRSYLKDGDAAYALLRSDGLGITSRNLSLIPIGIENRFVETDSDGDGLGDSLERAIGTNPNLSDTDSDGYSDGIEVKNGFDPLNPKAGAKSLVDSALTRRLSGRILIDIEKNGQAWYVNPENLKRYYLKDGAAAYTIMRYLSLGISDANLSAIPVADSKVIVPPATVPADTIVISDLNYATIPITEVGKYLDKPLTFNITNAGLAKEVCETDSYIDGSGGKVFDDHTLCSSYYSKASNMYSDPAYFSNFYASISDSYDNRDGKNYLENEGIDHLVKTFYIKYSDNKESNRLSLTITR